MKFRLVPYLAALSALVVVVVVSGVSLIYSSKSELFQPETRSDSLKELSAVIELQYPLHGKDRFGTAGEVFLANESIFPKNPAIMKSLYLIVPNH